MRRLLLLTALFFILCGANSGFSQILMNENFTQNPGDTINGNGWLWINSYVNPIRIATPGLTYSGYVNSGIGNMARVSNNGQDLYKQFDSVLTGSVYVSYMLRVDSVQATGDYFFALLPSTTTSNYTLRTFIKSAAGGYQIGISKSTEAANYYGTTLNLGTTYLVVAKYTFNTGTTQDDQLSLFVFSGAIPGSEPSPSIGPITGTQTDSPNISRIALRQGSAANAPSLDIDGFRVFTSWGNLVGITPITSVAEKFSLSQNYPNPFNPSTVLSYNLKADDNVKLTVFNLVGQSVRVLVDGYQTSGYYEVVFDATDLPAGIYLYKLQVGDYSSVKRMTLVK